MGRPLGPGNRSIREDELVAAAAVLVLQAESACDWRGQVMQHLFFRFRCV